MESYYFEQPKKKKPEEKKKSLWQEMFSFAENGKLKSLDAVYGLILAFVFVFFFFGAQNLMTLWFEDSLSGLSRGWLSFAEIAIPAVVCTLILCGINLLIKKSHLFPMGFGMALLMELIVIIYILFSYPADTRAYIMQVIMYMFFLPLLFGGIAVTVESIWLGKRRKAKEAESLS